MKKHLKTISAVVVVFSVMLATVLVLFDLTGQSRYANEENSKVQENSEENLQQADTNVENIAVASADEYKAMWISYLEFQTMDLSSKESFVNEITQMFQNCKDLGLNTVIVHVRPFGDALYESNIFPASHLLTGTQGDELAYDPLSEMISIAHSMSLKIEAWINPYRVRLRDDLPGNISSDNPANNEELTFIIGDGIYYNPALSEVRQMVIDGVLEIINNYDVDGIHFDDYFYPTTDLTIDAQEYLLYQGDLSQEDWRRENVNILIRDVYSAIKAVDPSITFGISPQGNNSNNYNIQYSDVKLWLSTDGYADYILPQLYWGFDYTTSSGSTQFQFKNLVDEWAGYERSENVKLYIGLGAYRIGAGDGGSNEQDEWQTGKNLADMINFTRQTQGVSGYVLYRYDNLYKPQVDYSHLVEKEVSNIALINGTD